MILVAIGANLPGPDGASPIETCRRAAAALQTLPGLRVSSVSSWYETDPVPPSGQPAYVNGVARLEGETTPERLLAGLHAIEAAHGRARGLANAARTLDLDIVSMGDLVRATPDPVLPHPRAHERAFVLIPLRDVAPSWQHPSLHLRIDELIGRLAPQGIRPAANR